MGSYFGKYSGIVVDNADAAKLGVVKVSVPTIFPAEEQVPARAALPFGYFFVPEVDTKVWVEFEGGDSALALWTGVQHSAGTYAPEAETDYPAVRVVKTVSGHLLIFNDTAGKESVVLSDGKNAHVLTFDKDGVKLTDGKNGHEIVLDASGVTITDGVNSHELVLDSAGVTVKHGGGSAKAELQAAGAKVSFGASSAEVGPAGIVLTGSQIKLGGQGAAFGVLRAPIDMGIGNLGAPVPLTLTGPGSPIVKTM